MNTHFRVTRFIFGKELNQTKFYETKEQAINATNSWVNDCTVDHNLRKGRYTEIDEVAK